MCWRNLGGRRERDLRRNRRGDQTGYVFYARQAYDIAGWRKSDSEIAAFTFTSIPKSYAARTGRPQNVGVIGRGAVPRPLYAAASRATARDGAVRR